jgi:hypothetical protein
MQASYSNISFRDESCETVDDSKEPVYMCVRQHDEPDIIMERETNDCIHPGNEPVLVNFKFDVNNIAFGKADFNP